MKAINATLALLAVLFLGACGSAPVANAPANQVQAGQRWNGDYPVAELKRLPEGQQNTGVGFLDSPAAFAAVWSALKPGEAIPAVDFGKDMVVFVRNVAFYNRTNIFKTELKDGVLEVLAMETLSAIPVTDKAAMALEVVPRQGVKSVKSGETTVPVAGK